MEMSYDPDADALYIQVREGEVKSTKEIDANTLLDIDKNGKILGIEILKFLMKYNEKQFLLSKALSKWLSLESLLHKHSLTIEY